jgi:chorismate dehydratase
MTTTATRPGRPPVRHATRIGSVSYLNAKPLIHGLDEADDLHLSLDVPAKLIDGLRDGRFDVALLPVIDYQRLDGLRIIPSGGIGCDGPTLTVRLFSRVPIEQVRTLACDAHSHTSVALARVILAEAYGITPRFVELDTDDPTADPAAEARLLIGDKVVCEEPAGYPHQLDLGEAWHRLTGLPFLFAAWVARAGIDLGDLPDRLSAAKSAGLAAVDGIVDRFAVPRGWPADLARRYMTEFLKYDVGPRQLEAVRLFHALAFRHGMLDRPPRGLLTTETRSHGE